MSVAIAQVLGSALVGQSRERSELADRQIPLEARLAVVPSRDGPDLLRRLFEPLGYEVETTPHRLDPAFPAWGESRYFTLGLVGEQRLTDLLRHLYVLVPVLDDAKHYYVGEDEVRKLLDKGEGWLAGHPERDLIARRYLRHQRGLTRLALERLISEEDPVEEEVARRQDAAESEIEERIGLHEQRLGAVLGALRTVGAKRVLDLGCGEGRLLRMLLDDRTFDRIVGMDVSMRQLEVASARLRLADMPEAKRARIELIHGSLVYRDARLGGFDAAAVVEVVEHLDAPRLQAFERVLFEHARPGTVVLTTPNREYNVRFAGLAAGDLRHRDHRFEWTRAEFQAWTAEIGKRFGYDKRIVPIGPEDPEVGAPSQMAIFARKAAS
jgi:3' terminal RNA ribose 2'-O-methyltransferase Hen1